MRRIGRLCGENEQDLEGKRKMSSYETDVRRRKMRNRAKQRRIRKLKAIGALVSMMLLIVALIAGIVTIVKEDC